MKLLKPKTGYWVFGRGNVNTVTTLVEVRWLEFRTGVRFPSAPPYIEDVVITVARLPREQEERFESGIFYHFWGTYSNFQKLFMGKRTTVFRILRR